MPDRFSSIVTFDDGHHRGVARSTAGMLARRGGLPVTVFEAMDDDRSRPPAGITAVRVVTVSGRRPAEDVATRVAERDGALLVLDAFGGGPRGDRLFDESAETLLTSVRQPMIVIGPRVEDPTASSLLTPVDGTAACSTILPAVARWSRTFEKTRVTVIALDPPDSWPPDDADPTVDAARRALADLSRVGVTAGLVRRETFDPAAPLLDIATSADVLVVPGPAWPGGAQHWYSTVRCLIRGASCPVLVVPTSCRPGVDS